MVPSPTQLQAFARNVGEQMKFSELKPTIELCRSKLLKAANGSQVTVVDTFNANIEGKLWKTEVQGTKWTVDVIEGGKRLICKSAKEPAIAISTAWAGWIQGEEPKEEKEAAGGGDDADRKMTLATVASDDTEDTTKQRTETESTIF
jgi:hypothetical protein